VATKSKGKATRKAARRRKAVARKKSMRAKAKACREADAEPPRARTPAGTAGVSVAGSEVSVEDEIAQVNYKGPRVVILGAGASVAACPRGDA
jgi:hypothetical protein